MGKLVHYYIHGRGRGHATRSLPVVRALRHRGLAVRVFTGQAAGPIFDTEPGGSSAIMSTPLGVGPRAIRIVASRLRQVHDDLRMEKPDLVISDGDMPAAWVSRWRAVPSVAIGHGLVFAHCRRIANAPRAAWFREAMKARAASVGARQIVAVNFAPCTPRDPGRTTVAAPTLRPGLVRSPEATSEEAPFVCYFRDDNGDHAVRMLLDRGLPVTLFTDRAAPEVSHLPGVTTQPRRPDLFAQALKTARGVVSSAGSQLISECQALGVPQLALYAKGDDEQRLNVAMLRHFAMGEGMPLHGLEVQAIDRLLQNTRQPRSRPTDLPDTVDAVCAAVTRLI